MIRRAAQGNPWIFRGMHRLTTGTKLPAPTLAEVGETLPNHVIALNDYSGEYQGLRIARKHTGRYLKQQPEGKASISPINQLDDVTELNLIADYFNTTQELAA